MFIGFENVVINLKLVEIIRFYEEDILIGMSSGEYIYLDSKHTEKLERSLIIYNQIGGHEHD